MSDDPSRQHIDDPAADERPDSTAKPRKEPRTISPWSLLLGGAVLAAIVLGQWTWLIPILGLALLITVHEFGHFIAAKSFGMRVEKFYVGFPPPRSGARGARRSTASASSRWAGSARSAA